MANISLNVQEEVNKLLGTNPDKPADSLDRFPILSDRDLAVLDRMVPERCPHPSQTEREIWMAVGERRLVKKLLAAKETHNKNKG